MSSAWKSPTSEDCSVVFSCVEGAAAYGALLPMAAVLDVLVEFGPVLVDAPPRSDKSHSKQWRAHKQRGQNGNDAQRLWLW
eukprot:CAMPEP_0171088858 /NCGR_PEP_ID=MMETSP0766_2-20121228/21036_1 /TAXON_ID=439317 /ORGANISM="Gambierdiscus australes, Strain CAWD 149" /LENGTH=80 /DNA_ID=CAMNT_0011546683 /DNA_START=346 /DNA_END=584 /DNA_ORIENTATION=-